ncbi:MAG: undecaprenyl-diphosphate phosphatase [Candidatus Aegiribacteria sp.]|nr:undecaprenyl-diphosphate phosphatase [Candidatus Aegiribacteria sp.]
MTFLSVIILAVIQGLTEFLPVSSSGHLALAGMILKVPEGDITFEIVVHLGTLMAVLAVYRKDLGELVIGIFRRKRESLVLAGLLIAGSIPAGLAGFLLADSIEKSFDNPVIVSLMLLVTGCILFSTRFAKRGTRDNPNLIGSFIVGLSQAMALLPGISRSGFTISTGLFAGIRREKAARFSFLLSIPAIAGAAVLKLGDAVSSGIDVLLLITGFAISALTGYFALMILLRFLKAGKFSVFAWYCWLLGLTGLTVALIGS